MKPSSRSDQRLANTTPIARAVWPWARLAAALLAGVAALGVAPFVSVPYSNPEEIVGRLSLLQIHPATNLVRFAICVFAPAVTWLAMSWLRPIAASQTAVGVPQTVLSASEKATDRNWFRGTVLLIWVHAFASLASSAAHLYHPDPLDFLHDGESLTPAYNSVVTGQFWRGSFFCHGLLYDPL